MAVLAPGCGEVSILPGIPFWSISGFHRDERAAAPIGL
jgi:hypothetical protein